jgi:hypothetical protein
MHKICWFENLQGRDHSEDLSLDGKVTVEWILKEIIWKRLYRVDLVQNRNQ